MTDDWRRQAWLSTGDVARVSGMSAAYVRARIEAGELAATAWRSGSRVIYRIRPADLDAFIERCARQPFDGSLDER